MKTVVYHDKSEINPSRQINVQKKEVQNYIYCQDDIIGKGQFSSVFKGYNKLTNEIVAIKVIDLKSIVDPVFFTMLENEISVLKLFESNPNLLRLHEVFNTVNSMYIVTECCTQGDLAHLILKQKKFSEQDAMNIFKQLVNGLKELKNKSIIHRDIKPANILLSNGISKFGDFGFSVSKHIKSAKQNQLELYNVGTPLYMAPETILHNMYSHKSDIWSLGVVLFEMLYGVVPFYSNSEPELVSRLKEHGKNKVIKWPNNGQKISGQTQEILMGLLDYDHRQRWSVETVYQCLNQQNSSVPPTTRNKTPSSSQQYQNFSSVTQFNAVTQRGQTTYQIPQSKRINNPNQSFEGTIPFSTNANSNLTDQKLVNQNLNSLPTYLPQQQNILNINNYQQEVVPNQQPQYAKIQNFNNYYQEPIKPNSSISSVNLGEQKFISNKLVSQQNFMVQPQQTQRGQISKQLQLPEGQKTNYNNLNQEEKAPLQNPTLLNQDDQKLKIIYQTQQQEFYKKLLTQRNANVEKTSILDNHNKYNQLLNQQKSSDKPKIRSFNENQSLQNMSSLSSQNQNLIPTHQTSSQISSKYYLPYQAYQLGDQQKIGDQQKTPPSAKKIITPKGSPGEQNQNTQTTSISSKPFISTSNNSYLLHMVKFVSRIKQLLSLDSSIQTRYQTNIESDKPQHIQIGFKLQYCMLKYCVIKIKLYESKQNTRCGLEYQLIINQYYQQQSEQNILQKNLGNDQKFSQIYNNNFIDSEEFVSTFQFYLKLSIIYLNQYLELSLKQFKESNISNVQKQLYKKQLQQSIILLDFLTTLYLLNLLAKQCGDDIVKFETISGIQDIAGVQVAERVNISHFQIVSQKIRDNLN